MKVKTKEDYKLKYLRRSYYKCKRKHKRGLIESLLYVKAFYKGFEKYDK